MNKKEATLLLKELINNPLISLDYKNKLIDLSKYIDGFIDNCKDIGVEEATYKEMSINNSIICYTDGGCLVNPGGPGGYGIIIFDGENKKELSKGFKSTTNNRMELRGPLEVLKCFDEPKDITIYSDSEYFCNSINKGWLENWTKTNWKKGTVKNIDLWEQIYPLLKFHNVTVNWVKGHSDNEYNARCDELATLAYKDELNLIDDEGFNI